MAVPQSLLQAAAIRLTARLSSSLADSAASLAVLAQDAPARLQQELNLFWEEVEREAERLAEWQRVDRPQARADKAVAEARMARLTTDATKLVLR
jgi:hypothetical protein